MSSSAALMLLGLLVALVGTALLVKWALDDLDVVGPLPDYELQHWPEDHAQLVLDERIEGCSRTDCPFKKGALEERR